MKINGIGGLAWEFEANNTTVNKQDTEFKDMLQKAMTSQEDKQLKEAAMQFEALFMYQMFSKMRETVARGGLIAESMSEKVFQGMYDQEVSIRAAETGSLGLADMIYEQLKRK